MYEFLTLYYAWDDREWTEIGTYAAKIMSDIFFKAPFGESWTYNNSDVINENWGSPLDPWNGFIKEINYLLAFFDADQIDLGDFHSSDASVSKDEINADKNFFSDTFNAGNGDIDPFGDDDDDFFDDNSFDDWASGP